MARLAEHLACFFCGRAAHFIVLIVVLSVIQQCMLLLLLYMYRAHFVGLGIDKDAPMWFHLL